MARPRRAPLEGRTGERHQRAIIQDWVTALGANRSATTVKRAYGVLSSILDDSVDDRRIIANPAKGVKTKRKLMRGRVYLNHRQVDRLAHEAGDSSGVVLVLAYTGIRWGEMIALRVRDVDATRRRLSIERNAVEVGTEIHVGTPKNHERRSVPYIQMLDSLFEKACVSKPPEALLIEDDLDAVAVAMNEAAVRAPKTS